MTNDQLDGRDGLFDLSELSQAVFLPKCLGAWNLHRLTLADDLEAVLEAVRFKEAGFRTDLGDLFSVIFLFSPFPILLMISKRSSRADSLLKLEKFKITKNSAFEIF